MNPSMKNLPKRVTDILRENTRIENEVAAYVVEKIEGCDARPSGVLKALQNRKPSLNHVRTNWGQPGIDVLLRLEIKDDAILIPGRDMPEAQLTAAEIVEYNGTESA